MRYTVGELIVIGTRLTTVEGVLRLGNGYRYLVWVGSWEWLDEDKLVSVFEYLWLFGRRYLHN